MNGIIKLVLGKINGDRIFLEKHVKGSFIGWRVVNPNLCISLGQDGIWHDFCCYTGAEENKICYFPSPKEAVAAYLEYLSTKKDFRKIQLLH
ncbi:MAG: hypothetical protein H7A25_10180 [Leptospiraceae bacterium]|nr:hypothetical protein [Leptospiraceae bacterium]